jgi:hypothetical protein
MRIASESLGDVCNSLQVFVQMYLGLFSFSVVERCLIATKIKIHLCRCASFLCQLQCFMVLRLVQ